MSILDALTRVLRPDDTLYARSLKALEDDARPDRTR
jgi:hypothetical protein